jgi:hypothetical protein
MTDFDDDIFGEDECDRDVLMALFKRRKISFEETDDGHLATDSALFRLDDDGNLEEIEGV